MERIGFTAPCNQGSAIPGFFTVNRVRLAATRVNRPGTAWFAKVPLVPPRASPKPAPFRPCFPVIETIIAFVSPARSQMSYRMKKFVQLCRPFLRQEGGSVTVEFSIWMPVLIAVMFLGINATVLFSAQSNFWNISRDTARVVSRHAMDVDQAEAYARDRARFSNYEPEVEVRIDDQLGIVTVVITADMRALIPFDVASFALGETFSVAVSQSMEPI